MAVRGGLPLVEDELIISPFTIELQSAGFSGVCRAGLRGSTSYRWYRTVDGREGLAGKGFRISRFSEVKMLGLERNELQEIVKAEQEEIGVSSQKSGSVSY